MLQRTSSTLALLLVTLIGHRAGAATTLTVDPGRDRAPISPLVYGTNSPLEGVVGITAERLGGGRLTSYNWENNASYGGQLDGHRNDDKLTSRAGIPSDDPRASQPGFVVTSFLARTRAEGAYPLLALPMAGFVARDKAGPVAETEVAPSARWDVAMARKGAPFSAVPDLTDGRVYTDELVNLLTTASPGADAGVEPLRGYSLDNEPELWADLLQRLHPERTSCAEIIRRSAELAAAVKDADPRAQIFGPASYGWLAYVNFQNAPDWEAVRGSFPWFIGWYLAQMQTASQTAGRRLLDVLDLHYYPEATGPSGRVVWGTEPKTSAAANGAARTQAPRALWDETYVEPSWISDAPIAGGGTAGGPLRLLPRLLDTISQTDPEVKVALSEWDFGGGTHISGGIAAADALGIFGHYGVYLASYNAVEPGPFVASAFRIYRDYDGARGSFGNTRVRAQSSDSSRLAVHASILGADTTQLHVVVVNRDLVQAEQATFQLMGSRRYLMAHVFGFGPDSAAVTERTPINAISGGSVVYEIPAATVLHFVFDAEPGPWCGDGSLNPGEACDEGPANGTQGHCDTECKTSVQCGDGAITGNEICDDGPANGTYGHCRSDCAGPGARCGDWKVQEGEGCDDGNARGGDGCSATCTSEGGDAAGGDAAVGDGGLAADGGVTLDGSVALDGGAGTGGNVLDGTVLGDASGNGNPQPTTDNSGGGGCSVAQGMTRTTRADHTLIGLGLMGLVTLCRRPLRRATSARRRGSRLD